MFAEPGPVCCRRPAQILPIAATTGGAGSGGDDADECGEAAARRGGGGALAARASARSGRRQSEGVPGQGGLPVQLHQVHRVARLGLRELFCTHHDLCARHKEEKYITSADSIDIMTNLILKDSTDHKLFLKRAYLNRKLESGPGLQRCKYGPGNGTQSTRKFPVAVRPVFRTEILKVQFPPCAKAAELDPNNEQAYIKLAETYLIIKNYSMAKKVPISSLSINQDNEQAFFLKGIVHI